MMGLQFDHLSLTLRGRPVLCDVSGSLPAASVTVILGANGAGKSTLLSCLAALRAPDSGVVTLNGQPLLAIPPMERARQIGLLPQQADIHWDINIRALVALGRLPHHGRWGRSAADEAAIDEAMQQTDCARFATRKALRLSGGEQARVLLARVLAGKPEWVLADEPLANLDPAHQLDAMACFRAAATAGAGVVLVLHDLTQAARIADHLIVMKGGGIIASGPAAQVLTPEVLQTAYGVRVHIGHDVTGAPVIAPIARVAR
jgi:iron complex transport system ATP-binding protein